jgi:hypothetical protein
MPSEHTPSIDQAVDDWLAMERKAKAWDELLAALRAAPAGARDIPPTTLLARMEEAAS